MTTKRKTKRDYTKQALQMVQRHLGAKGKGVSKVIDADEPLVVHVTAKDVKSGARKDGLDCAMAMACKREHNADAAIVSRSMTYIITGDVAVRYKNPQSISREVVSFDRSGLMEPGEYTLASINPSARLGVDRGRKINRSPEYTNRGDGRYRKVKPRHVTEGIRAHLRAR